MSWMNLAILTAACFGVVNVFDSHLISKRMPGLRVFLLPVGIIMLVYGIITFYLSPLPAGTSPEILLIALATAVIRTASVILMLYTLKKEEVSRVIPVVHTSPIFVAIMAVPLLGEQLNYLQWLAIFVVVTGVVVISFRQGSSGTTNRLSKTLPLLLGASLLMAVADISSKYVLAYINAWHLLWLTTLCTATIFLLFSIRPGTIRETGKMLKRKSTLYLLVFNETLAYLAIVLQLWAIERGPVSLVSTITGSRPLFVLIFALILSRATPDFLTWQSGRNMLVRRLIATAMIISGITIIHLT